MSDGLFPPYAQAEGPLQDDMSLVRAFARGAGEGRSPRFHIEDVTLVAEGQLAMAVRIGGGACIVRVDVPDDLVADRALVAKALVAEGLDLLDEETLFGTAVALQVLGIRLSNWDLWGNDIDMAFAALREAAAGDDTTSFFDFNRGDAPGA